MKNNTKGILATVVLGAGALGIGLALNADANEYEPLVEYDAGAKATFAEGFADEFFYGDGDIITSTRITSDEDGGSWEVSVNGEVVSYGYALPGDNGMVVSIVTDEDGNMLDTPVIHFFETEAEYHQWLIDQGYDLEEVLSESFFNGIDGEREIFQIESSHFD